MAKSTKSQPAKPKGDGITVTDAHAAPVIYFDGASNFGHLDGIINVTLAMNRHTLVFGEPTTAVMASAHLRCSVSSARALLGALQRALSYADQPPPTAH